ncbi:phage/plasmid primase, P4 family, C-terminal domain-containing protein [Yoonia litorea]|uniref:Phage/plasmid primase, P4 family, C-terminal domain-containing protein n=2 Tax=Yoonia litorea TaxID=1123755 RepID=A0A1I6MDF0_9RHOB|nr:phage/plasmid primase, P4 family [Yoonia litorea]SFS13776.1 phage/plasmid primase, P4 family, C-terminal domain-containing protein [Yoonia litorea]
MDRLFRKSALMRDKFEKRADYRRNTIRNAARLCKRVYTGEADRVAQTLDDRSPVDAIAKAFVSCQAHAGRWMHVQATGKDYLYNGRHWSICSNEELLSAIRDFVAFRVRGQRASQHKPAFWEEVRKAVRIDPSVARAPDADLSLLNTPAGTLNLATGLMQAHNPADMLTHMTAVAPEPYQGTRWDRFVQEIVGRDTELAAFLQVAIGAALSGAVDDHWFALLFGQGRNGKSLFIETAIDGLGSYAIQIPSQALMPAKNPVGRDVLAQLQGKRLVITSEVDSAAHIDEVLIRSLTGDKRISARPLYRDTFSFRRSFKLVMVGNHRPQLRTDDTAMRSRLKLVSLDQDFSDDRGDPSLGKTFQSELGSVLQWMIDGSQKYRELGRLPHSRHVEEQVEDYFSSQATVEQWIEERIIRVCDEGQPVSSWPKAGNLYSDYSDWCRCTGTNPANQTRWSDAMQRNGFRKLRSNGWRYVGAKVHSGGHQFSALPAPSKFWNLCPPLLLF